MMSSKPTADDGRILQRGLGTSYNHLALLPGKFHGQGAWIVSRQAWTHRQSLSTHSLLYVASLLVPCLCVYVRIEPSSSTLPSASVHSLKRRSKIESIVSLLMKRDQLCSQPKRKESAQLPHKIQDSAFALSGIRIYKRHLGWYKNLPPYPYCTHSASWLRVCDVGQFVQIIRGWLEHRYEILVVFGISDQDCHKGNSRQQQRGKIYFHQCPWNGVCDCQLRGGNICVLAWWDKPGSFPYYPQLVW